MKRLPYLFLAFLFAVHAAFGELASITQTQVVPANTSTITTSVNTTFLSYALPTRGLVSDWDAQTGITASSTLISQWNDLSGNGWSLTQATAGSKPTWAVDEFGRSIVRFQRINVTNGDDTMSSAGPSLDARVCSIWVVGRLVNTVSEGLVYINSYAGGAANLRMISSTTLAQGIYATSRASTLRASQNTSLLGAVSASTGVATYTSFQTSGNLTAVTSGSGTGVQIGAFGATTFAAMDVYRIRVYNVVQTAAEIAQTQAALAHLYALPISNFPKRMVVDGDSISAGSDSTDQNTYPYQFAHLTENGDWQTFNQATSGATVSTLITRASSTDAFFDASIPRNVLVVMIGRNNATTTAGATIYADLVPYVQARVAAGWEVWVCTCIATTNSVIQARLVDLNALITSSIIADAGATKVIPYAASPIFANSAAAGNLTYYQADGTHLTNEGYRQLALILSANQ